MSEAPTLNYPKNPKTHPDKTTEKSYDCDCSECGCQYGVERRERKDGRTKVFKWCQDCGSETD